MAKDLNKAFETENGIRVGGVVIPDSVVDTIRSSKPTFTGDLLTSLEFYNSLTQTTGNRIAKSDFSYASEVLTGQVNTYYATDGTTVLNTETLVYSYSGDDLLKVEVT
jgi:hypothetical protein